MNSVYIDSAVAASPIYIGPTNANSVIIGNTNAITTLVGGVKCNNYDKNNTAQELLIGQSVTGPSGDGHVIRIGENVTTGVIAIGNGNYQNGRITIGGSGNLARTIVIGSPTPAAMPISSIELNGKVTLQRSLILQPAANYVAPSLNTELGFSLTTVLASAISLGTTTSTTEILSASASIPIGTYMISYAVRINGTAASTIQTIQAGLSINGGNMYATSMLSGSFSVDTGVEANIGLTGTWIGKITSIQTPSLRTYGKWTGSNPQATTNGQGTSIMIVRIA